MSIGKFWASLFGSERSAPRSVRRPAPADDPSILLEPGTSIAKAALQATEARFQPGARRRKNWVRNW